MTVHTKRYTFASLLFLVVLLVDQGLKFWVKTNFFYGEELQITSWFRLLFIENNGMAFGFELGSKLFLTLFRIVAVIAGLYILVRLCHKTEVRMGFLLTVAVIVAGALGNVIDCVAYGLIFDNPLPPFTATFLPDQGYGTLLHGRVVDMFYFPIVSWYWPDWMPFVGGDHFVFFQPIFNFADACLSVGMAVLILFYNKYLQEVSIMFSSKKVDS